MLTIHICTIHIICSLTCSSERTPTDKKHFDIVEQVRRDYECYLMQIQPFRCHEIIAVAIVDSYSCHLSTDSCN